MLRVVLIDANDMTEDMMESPDSARKAFASGGQLNSVCFDTKTHEVSSVTCHLAVRRWDYTNYKE